MFIIDFGIFSLTHIHSSRFNQNTEIFSRHRTWCVIHAQISLIAVRNYYKQALNYANIRINIFTVAYIKYERWVVLFDTTVCCMTMLLTLPPSVMFDSYPIYCFLSFPLFVSILNGYLLELKYVQSFHFIVVSYHQKFLG